MLTNAGLAVAIENIDGLEAGSVSEEEKQLHKKQNIYFTIILCSTFDLAAVRLVGVCCFSTSFRTDTFRVRVLLLEAQSLQMVPEKLISLSPFPYTMLPRYPLHHHLLIIPFARFDGKDIYVHSH